MIKGKFFSVGTGPGDKKLITLKAVEVISECDIIAYPESGAGENAVLKIAADYIKGKHTVGVDMPMTRDKSILAKRHNSAAKRLAELLDSGKSIAFLTLGDPTIYSTTLYVHQILQKMGYDTEIIPGVPSFCAAAATLNIPLCEGGEALHIIPASYGSTSEALTLSGSKVLMKSGKSLSKIKQEIPTDALACAVECCGMENEKIHKSIETLSDTSSYFCVMIVKEGKGIEQGK